MQAGQIQATRPTKSRPFAKPDAYEGDIPGRRSPRIGEFVDPPPKNLPHRRAAPGGAAGNPTPSRAALSATTSPDRSFAGRAGMHEACSAPCLETHAQTTTAPSPGRTHLSARSGGWPRRILKLVYFPIRFSWVTKTWRRTPGLSKRPRKPRTRTDRDAPTAPVLDARTTNGPRRRYGQPPPRQRTVIFTPAGAVTAKRSSRTPSVV